MKKLLNNTTLFQRFIITLLLFGFLPLISIGIIGYSHVSEVLLDMVIRSNQQTLSQIKSQGDNMMEDADEILTQLSIHSEMQELLKDDPYKNEYDMYSEAKFFSEYAQNVLFSHNYISKLTLYNNHKYFDSIGRLARNRDLTAIERSLQEQLQQQYIAYSPVYDCGGRRCVSIGRSVIDVKTGNKVGIILLEIELEEITNVIENIDLMKYGSVILSNSDEILSYTSYNAELDEELLEKVNDSQENDLIDISLNGHRYLLLVKEVSLLDWKMTGIIPYEEMQSETRELVQLLLGVMVFMVVILFIITFFIRWDLFNPILRLKNAMQQVEKGDFETRFILNKKHEIGDLSRHFNRMVHQIDQLIKQVYEAELAKTRMQLLAKEEQLQSLQEKITPHFLSNTLNAISWTAQKKGVREIQYVVDALSNMLRYSLDVNDEKMVPLYEEYEYIELYATIIEFRLEGNFRFYTHLPLKAKNTYIPRLTLQPIVENVMKHANEENEDKVEVTISTVQYTDYIEIEIQDNGSGIPEEELELVRKNLVQQKKFNNKGIGLMNVHQRLKLIFGEPYGLAIDSRQGEGTSVKIIVPINLRVND
ncbi:HAMP domain-containing protein [Gracilibacillus salitolerans]|uniref:histidine kinase n=1 Tax=Gracilibacillus salitolerans TaxID=2663022 RepID=A0A5Q2TTX9_9BACI|nr:histidine kinase [Gracilibacillus salitolerans]QGH36238.1 HAMP domain-containing protein [Gracilibacillus salitolerans]